MKQNPAPNSATYLLERWRQQSRPLWRKHHRAVRYMMRWLYVPGRKPRLRHKKWAGQYERTLNRIPMPPEDESPNAPGEPRRTES